MRRFVICEDGFNVVQLWKQRGNKNSVEVHSLTLRSNIGECNRTRGRLATCTAGYLFNPVQLIPSFNPAIGFLDNPLVLFFGAKVLRMITPPNVLTECHELAKAAELS